MAGASDRHQVADAARTSQDVEIDLPDLRRQRSEMLRELLDLREVVVVEPKLSSDSGAPASLSISACAIFCPSAAVKA